MFIISSSLTVAKGNAIYNVVTS